MQAVARLCSLRFVRLRFRAMLVFLAIIVVTLSITGMSSIRRSSGAPMSKSLAIPPSPLTSIAASTFKMTACQSNEYVTSVQQQLLRCCDESGGEDLRGEQSACYSIVKPHILSMTDSSNESCSLNLEHYNLGPQEMATWLPVLQATNVSEMRLSHNRIGAGSISCFLPVVAGRPLGGVGKGVVKL